MTSSLFRLLATLALFAGIALAPGHARAETYHTCAGFIDSLPATISTQGVWCLRENLDTGITAGWAITISANNVTIDCNGFKIGGLAAGDSADTIGIFSNLHKNITVRNCNVRGFRRGIYLSNGSGHLIEDNRIDNSLTVGIVAHGSNNLVQRNRIYDTGGRPGDGVFTGIIATGDVIDNTVAGVFADEADGTVVGINFRGVGSVARNNRVRGFGNEHAFGIRVGDPGTTIDGNQVAAPAGTNGMGLFGKDTMTACSNNVVTGFGQPMVTCIDAGGNTAL